SEGRWAFDRYTRHSDLLADQKAWGKAQQLVANHIMPPHGEPAPSAQERRKILDWIDQAVFYVDPQQPDPGRVTLRRLNRAEYNNSVRDVFGIEMQPANQFPADDAGYGFDNIADVLSISPLHFEKYLAAAREVAGEVTRLRSPPRVGVELTGDKLTVFAGEPELHEKTLRIKGAADQVGTTVRFPVETTYRVVIRAAVGKSGEELLPIDVLCDGRLIATLAPTAHWKVRPGPMATAFTLVKVPEGEHRIALRVRPPVDSAPLPEQLGAVEFLGISGPFTPIPPETSDYLRGKLSRPAGVPILRLSGEDLDGGSGRSSLDTGRAWFVSNGYRHAPVLLPATGEYRVRFKVGAQQVGDEKVKFEVRLADRTLGPFTVTAGSQVEQWIETTSELPAGQHDWQVWFINEYKDAETAAERYFWLHEFTIEGPLAEDYGLSREEALALLKQSARRLFRRPLAASETERVTRLFDSAATAGQLPLAALSVGLEGLLVSPKFLYHPQPVPAGDVEKGTLIDEFTLASRLSYFLWSSTPDEELLTLAERGQLRSHMAAQVKRMIRDPKSAALTQNFAGQWLQLRDIEQATPDRQVFPGFDAALAGDMRRESEMLFEHILRENRSVIEFVSADYTFLNARLAKHYGLSEPPGDGFSRVSLAGTPRRGIVTHASVLTLTSHPTRTSPVKRGKWLLEQLLGVEPPPAPRDVPPLPDTRENESLPLRTRLEEHRANAACASCHALLDPMGFALENYDAIGRWRVTEGSRPLDTSGQLISGERFQDWSELRELLVRTSQDDFRQCLTEHLLTYALGREVTYRDKLAVRDITDRNKSADQGFQDLILAICESVPFQRMRPPSTEHRQR
ncbi:MAG TPA: DUF1592 domain-containing protein, partial [Bauldia sp.]|nr:DUF1592 domain-containing protein [Bauldia sp.]